jgi:hypothetical protein
MGRTGAVPTAAGDTGLGPFRGYRLAPISPDDRKNIKAIFANNWVNYSSLKLKAGSTTLSSLSLSSEDTYFAAAPVQAQYTLQTINMPLGCAVATTSLVDEDGNTSALSAGTTFTISPEQLLQLSVSVSCDSTLSPGSIGELIATVSNTDPSDPGILSQSFIRMLAPITCDVNADGSVDAIDIADIMALNGTPAPPGSPYDVDGDGIITVNDARICTLQCSLPLCAVPPPQ